MIGAITIVVMSIIVVAALVVVLAWRRPWLALLLSSVICIWMVFCGTLVELTPMVIAGPAVILASAITVLARPFDPQANPRVRQIARLVLLGTLTVLFFGGLAAGLPGVILMVLCLYTVFRYSVEPREAITGTVISTLASCVRQNLPLTMALDSAAYGRRDMAGYIMRQINRWLVKGYSLSDAIRKAFPQCPWHIYNTIVASERMGQLAPALQALQQDIQERGQGRSLVNPIYPFYPVALVVTVMLLLLAYARFILPRFIEVTDLAGAIPPVTRWWLSVYRYLEYWLFWPVILGVLIVWLMAMIRRWLPRRVWCPRYLAAVVDIVSWHVPVLGWFTRHRSIIQAISILRLGLVAGSTIDGAIDSAASAGVNYCLRKRLGRWLEAIRQGQDVAKAAVQIGLPRPLVWAFDGQEGASQAIPILQTTESFLRASYAHRINMLTVVAWPCVTITMGIVVGCLAYATFGLLFSFIRIALDFVP